MSNQVAVKVRRVKTSTKGGYILTIDEVTESTEQSTNLGDAVSSEYGRSWSTKVVSNPPKVDAEVTIDLDIYDEVANTFKVDDPKSKNHGKMVTKNWLFLK